MMQHSMVAAFVHAHIDKRFTEKLEEPTCSAMSNRMVLILAFCALEFF
jgi:hypothetical protein